MNNPGKFFHVVLLTMVIALPAFGSEEGGKNFGGPNAVENTLEDDAAVTGAALGDRLAESWFDWKAKVQDDTGFGLGLDYSAVWLGSDKSGLSGEDAASSGMIRIYGAWELVGRGGANSGSFVWKVENRHKYGNIPPFDYGFELGYVGLFTPPFSDQGGRVTNFYWRQRLAGGRVTLVGGLLDATDYVDVNIFAIPWTGFVNFAFPRAARRSSPPTTPPRAWPWARCSPTRSTSSGASPTRTPIPCSPSRASSTWATGSISSRSNWD